MSSTMSMAQKLLKEAIIIYIAHIIVYTINVYIDYDAYDAYLYKIAYYIIIIFLMYIYIDISISHTYYIAYIFEMA